MPVRIGRVSSRLAAMLTWATAWVNRSPGTTPDDAGISGRLGYSSTGMVSSVNRPEPQITETFEPSVVTSTGLAGSEREMSARSRQDTRAEPASITSAATSTRAETS